MFSVTVGTEKQVAYANDIIRKPIINVEKKSTKLSMIPPCLPKNMGKEIHNLTPFRFCVMQSKATKKQLMRQLICLPRNL